MYVANKATEKSPWNGAINLWQAAAPGNGFISCTHPANSPIYLEARDNAGNVIYLNVVIGEVSYLDRVDIMLSEVKNSVSELEKWITAAEDGRAANTWVDSDSDGALGPDTNADLAADYAVTNGLCASYVANKTEWSPWNGAINLWQAAVPGAGYISCTHPANGTITLEAQDNNGTLIYVKFVHGETDYRDKVDILINSVKNSVSELDKWIRAADRGGTAQGMLTEIDTNGDGSIVVGTDMNNDALATAQAVANGLCTTYVDTKWTEWSPWNGYFLWVAGPPAAGQISCQHPANGTITVEAQDNYGNRIYQKFASGITPRERIDSVLNSLNETLPALNKWIMAGQKAGTA
jgi:hypothetical protein